MHHVCSAYRYCELLCGVYKLYQRPLREQQVPLAAEPSLQPHRTPSLHHSVSLHLSSTTISSSLMPKGWEASLITPEHFLFSPWHLTSPPGQPYHLQNNYFMIYLFLCHVHWRFICSMSVHRGAYQEPMGYHACFEIRVFQEKTTAQLYVAA